MRKGVKDWLKDNLNTIVTIISLVSVITGFAVAENRRQSDIDELKTEINAIHIDVLRNDINNVWNNGNLSEVPSEMLYHGGESCDTYLASGFNSRTKHRCEEIYDELRCRDEAWRDEHE